MFRQFLFLHIFALLLHTTCTIYAFSLSLSYETPINTIVERVSYNNLSYDTYYKVDSTYKYNIPSVILIHGIVAFITIVFHLLFYIPIHYKFGNTVWDQGYFTLRWIEYSFTCTLMSLSSIMTSGTDELLTVFSIMIYGTALQLIGCCIERMRYACWFLFAIGSLINLGTSIPSFWYVASAPSTSNIQIIEYVAFIFFYALFPINCLADATNSSRKNKFYKTDWIYNVLSLSSKFGLFWLQVGEVEMKYNSNAWTFTEVYVLGILFPILLLVIGIYNTPTNKITEKITEYKEEELSYYWKLVKFLATFTPIPN